MGSASSHLSVIFHSVARKALTGDPARKHMILQLKKKAEAAEGPTAAGSFEVKVGTPAVAQPVRLAESWALLPPARSDMSGERSRSDASSLCKCVREILSLYSFTTAHLQSRKWLGS